jgi:hypothetical protein
MDNLNVSEQRLVARANILPPQPLDLLSLLIATQRTSDQTHEDPTNIILMLIKRSLNNHAFSNVQDDSNLARDQELVASCVVVLNTELGLILAEEDLYCASSPIKLAQVLSAQWLPLYHSGSLRPG